VTTAASNDPEALDEARSLKTSALICVALRIGAIFSGATQGQLTTLLRFGSLLGDAFQIGDDIIDLKEDVAPFAQPATFGNQSTKDARLQVASLIAEAKNMFVAEFGMTHATLLLCEIADYIAERGSP
jgi:geranylgeranyl pyrophosphate synthase